MDITLLMVQFPAEVGTQNMPASLNIERVRWLQARRAAWRERTLQGRLLRALIQYPLDPLPYDCYPRRWPLLREALAEERPDLFVLHLPSLAHLADHCPPHVPIIAVLEEPGEAIVASSLGLETRKNVWFTRRETSRFARVYRRLEKRADAVVAISEAEKAQFRRSISAEKITVIPHGVDTAYFKDSGYQGRDIDVLVVGDLRNRRNFVGALRTWDAARLAADPTCWRWSFVGEIDSAVGLTLRRGGALVTGPVRDVRSYYERARAVLVPALEGSGVKTTSLQAWAMSRPLVASQVGAQGLPARSGENILIGDDPEALVEHLRTILGDGALAARIADSGRQTVEQSRDLSLLAQAFARLCVDTVGKSQHSAHVATSADV